MISEQAIYGIVGYPVEHSLSPVMHNAAFKELGVEATYQKFSVQENELDVFFEKLKKSDCPIFGLNVTVPYKEAVIKHLDSITPLVQKIGAVNTIVINKSRKLIGYNTDAPGFVAHLAELQFNTRGKSVAVLGAGGSARAILAALCLLPEQPSVVRIYNRTQERLDAVINDLKNRINLDVVSPVSSIDDLEVSQADILINTTSVGLKKDDEVLIEEELLHPGMLVYDLIYNPRETKLLSMARKKGAQTANGLGMLYYQGVLAFQHWANVQLDDKTKEVMRRSLEEAICNG